MQNIKEKIRYLFLHLISPKEIIFISLILFLAFFLFLAFLYKGSTYLMSERIMYSGNMSEGIIGRPKETNPYRTESQVDKDLHRLLFGTLIRNVVGEKFDLGLAKSVEVNSGKDTYKVKLRDEIYFSDETPITLDDILFSLDNVPGDKNYTVEKTDDNTLTFKLKEKLREEFLQTLTYPIIKKDLKFDNNFSKSLVTSSFFKISEIKKDLNGNILSISLERFNNGEDKIPYLKTYKLLYFENEVDAYKSFQQREIDLIGGIPGTTISKIKDDTSIKFESSLLPNYFAVFLNQNENETLREKALRKALNDIVDRESLANQVLGGYGSPLKNILGNKGSPLPAKEIIEQLTAKSTSSFSFQDGVLYMSTKKSQDTNSEKKVVKIKLTTIENTELQETAKFLSLAWKKIGVETEIVVINRTDLNETAKERDFEALLFGYSIKSPKDYYSFFSSKERTYPKLNISNYTSKQVDKILDILVTEKEQSRIDDLTAQLSVELEADNPVIILYKPQFVFAHFLKTQITLPNKITSKDDRYGYIEDWYINTEKVFNVFKQLKFIDQLDILLY